MAGSQCQPPTPVRCSGRPPCACCWQSRSCPRQQQPPFALCKMPTCCFMVHLLSPATSNANCSSQESIYSSHEPPTDMPTCCLMEYFLPAIWRDSSRLRNRPSISVEPCRGGGRGSRRGRGHRVAHQGMRGAESAALDDTTSLQRISGNTRAANLPAHCQGLWVHFPVLLKALLRGSSHL